MTSSARLRKRLAALALVVGCSMPATACYTYHVYQVGGPEGREQGNQPGTIQLPSISQVRLVHPSPALISFTHLGPKTAVFEFGLPNNETFPRFEEALTRALGAANIPYTLHWSKNSLIDPPRLDAMYGAQRISKWRDARRRIFGNDASLMQVFDNAHLVRAGLT